jgi:hypothetical protein
VTISQTGGLTQPGVTPGTVGTFVSVYEEGCGGQRNADRSHQEAERPVKPAA